MTARRGRGGRGGLGSHLGGLAAEEQAAEAYQRRGAEILARRHRNEAGEIDLILREGQVLVFVEVKQRRRGAAEAISERQWRRLGIAATQYMMTHVNETGPILGCRFDAVLVGGDGSLEIVENARSFDEH